MDNIDWTSEDPKVKEICDMIKKAHDLYKDLPAELKERVDLLMDEVLPMEEIGA